MSCLNYVLNTTPIKGRIFPPSSHVPKKFHSTVFLIPGIFQLWDPTPTLSKYVAVYNNIICKKLFNLLNPTGHVMHQQFNIQQLYFLPTYCIYVFCIYLRTNIDLCHLQHKLIGFYNRDEKCLLRGTNWVFK